mgnify:CR=1 FL=1
MDCSGPKPLDSKEPDLFSKSPIASPTSPNAPDALSTPLMMICRLLATLVFYPGLYIHHVKDAIYVYYILLP